MKHYVIIEAHSGYVWEEADADDPIAACKAIDRKIDHVEADEYWESNDHSTSTGYFVYEAPADWVPVFDGQSQFEIKRVMALPMVAKVDYTRASDVQ